MTTPTWLSEVQRGTPFGVVPGDAGDVEDALAHWDAAGATLVQLGTRS